jgi:hypothetical protein
VEYGGKLLTVIDHNPKRRRRNHHEDDEEEEDEDEEEDGEFEPYDDDTWAYSQVNLKGPSLSKPLLTWRIVDSTKPSFGTSHSSCPRSNIQKQ